MTTITYFSKTDTTERTTTSGTAELSDYTIAWSDLTNAGLADGDDVLMLVAVHVGSTSSANNNYSFAVGFGTSFAGRSEDTTSINRSEAPQTDGTGEQYLWIDRRTLTASQNIYFRGGATNANTASYREFACFIFKLSTLDSSDWAYTETDHSAVGNAPTSYDTSGASVTTAAAGDWLFIASTRFLVDDTASGMHLAINDGTSDIAEWKTEAEDSADERVFGTMAYKASLGSGVTVRARYKCTLVTTAPDCVVTKIFGLRLDAFADHAGSHTANTITHTATDTYQEFAGFGSYGLSNTGPLLILGLPIHAFSETNKHPYGRIQIGGSDWPAANSNRQPVGSNGASDRVGPFLYGLAASQSAGTLDIDLDCAEDTDISPNYSCVEQVAVAFSLVLASNAVIGTGAQVMALSTQAAAGKLNFAGTSAQIPTAASQAGAAALRFAATVGQTSTPPTQTISAHLIPFVGTAAQIGAPAVHEAAGLLTFLATLTQDTLPAVQAAEGIHIPAITGALAHGPSAATQALTAALQFLGGMIQTGAAVSQNAAAAQIMSGALSQDGAAAQQQSVGLLTILGSLDQSILSATQAAAAIQRFAASAAQDGIPATQALAGLLTFEATGDVTSTPAVQALAAAVEFIGAAAQAGIGATQAVIGSQGTAIAGGIVQTTLTPQQALTAALRFVAVAAEQSGAAVQDAAGTSLLTMTGTGALIAPATTQQAAGMLLFLGAAEQTNVAALQLVQGSQGIITGHLIQATGAVAQAAAGRLAYAGQVAQTGRPAQSELLARQLFSGIVIELAPLPMQEVRAVLPALLVLDEIDATVIVDGGRSLPVKALVRPMATVN